MMIIAVDFDGTLAMNSRGLGIDVGTPNIPLIEKLIEAKKKGYQLILWTCRGGLWLEEAILWCKDLGLEFDAHNENVPGYNYILISCKVVADLYIDDKSPGSIQYFLNKEL